MVALVAQFEIARKPSALMRQPHMLVRLCVAVTPSDSLDGLAAPRESSR